MFDRKNSAPDRPKEEMSAHDQYWGEYALRHPPVDIASLLLGNALSPLVHRKSRMGLGLFKGLQDLIDSA